MLRFDIVDVCVRRQCNNSIVLHICISIEIIFYVKCVASNMQLSFRVTSSHLFSRNSRVCIVVSTHTPTCCFHFHFIIHCIHINHQFTMHVYYVLMGFLLFPAAVSFCAPEIVRLFIQQSKLQIHTYSTNNAHALCVCFFG